MKVVGLASFVASLLFTICMYTFFGNIHALQNSPSTRILRVGVPWKNHPMEFVSIEWNGTEFIVGGFCVKVFEASIQTLDYTVEYIYHHNSSYDDIINQIVLQNLDAAVGDFTITSTRSKKVLFAQPFLDSGAVAVVPLKEDQGIISFGWVFTEPFTPEMWLLTAAFFISGGMVVYILESRNNQRIQAPLSRQFRRILWFSITSWFYNQDHIRTLMGRVVLVACFFVIGILQSCYTANLSAILTAQRLEPTFNDFRSVVASNLRIGYHMGSFVRDELLGYGVAEHRLVALEEKDYDYKVMSTRNLGAIIDERPYMQSLVAKHCNRLAFAGQTFTTQNWGFAYHRSNHQLVSDISIRILELSETGELLRLQKQWLPYIDSDCSRYSDPSGSSRLHVQHFWGLFVIAGLVWAIMLLVYTVQRKWNSSTVAPPTPPPLEGSSGPTPPPLEGSSGPTPPEGSPGHGGGGFIPGHNHGGSLTRKIRNLRRTKSMVNSMPFV